MAISDPPNPPKCDETAFKPKRLRAVVLLALFLVSPCLLCVGPLFAARVFERRSPAVASTRYTQLLSDANAQVRLATLAMDNRMIDF